MTAAAVWQADWRGSLVALFVPCAICVVVLAVLVRRAHRDDARRRAVTEASLAQIRADLETARERTGWYQSQARHDIEFARIVAAERLRARATDNRGPS